MGTVAAPVGAATAAAKCSKSPRERILGESTSQLPPARLLPPLVSLLLPPPAPAHLHRSTPTVLPFRRCCSIEELAASPASYCAARRGGGDLARRPRPRGRSRGRCRRKARWPPGGGRRPPPPPLCFPEGRIRRRGSSFSSFPRRLDSATGLLLFFISPAAGGADPGQCGLRGARAAAVTASSSATGGRPRLAADDLPLALLLLARDAGLTLPAEGSDPTLPPGDARGEEVYRCRCSSFARRDRLQ
jgi:hypothetical protein